MASALGPRARQRPPAVHALVSGRTHEHLRERARRARRARARQAARVDLRQPRHQHRAHVDLCRAHRRRRADRRRAGEARRHERRPRPPLHADGAGGRHGDARLRAHRRRALRRLRRLRAERARQADRRREAEGDPLGVVRHRGQSHHRVQAVARPGDRDLRAQARALRDPPAISRNSAARARTRSRLGRGHGGRHAGRLRSRRRDRSALHPLHVRHHGRSEGRGARQRRPRRRAEVEHGRGVRPGGGRDDVHRVRHRLGRRPLVHRLRSAPQGMHDRALRRQAGRHARSRRVLAAHRAAWRQYHLHGADGLPRDQEGGPAGPPHGQARSEELPRAVPRGRAVRSRHAALGGGQAEGSRDRPLVANGDRLAHRGQLRRPRHAAGEGRLADEGRARLRRARARRRGERNAGGHDRVDRDQPPAAARLSADVVEQRRRLRDVLHGALSGLLPHR